VVDNSASEKIRNFCAEHRVDYDAPDQNLGYGPGHNRVIGKYKGRSDFHIVINPDVYFEAGTFEPVLQFMDEQSDVGLCTPKIHPPLFEGAYRRKDQAL
ncbi:MAG: hypothetical protein ACPF9D_10065, partial [Owenweeksia sp.]